MYNVRLTAPGKSQREKLPDLLAAFRNMEIGKDNLEQMKPYWELHEPCSACTEEANV